MTHRAALYLRLSKEDDSACESSSIDTQRRILRAYAEENGFEVFNEYSDDGYSGTTFERPAFLRMLSDIERGSVNLVITKDLSRLGRDYLTTGRFLEEYFPKHRVRYIAVNDGYDSDSPFNDIAPFRNVVNELYARDTSKKIRSAFSAKMSDGQFIGAFAPYGYKKSPSDKHKLVEDAEAAAVVRRMFSLSLGGNTPSEIARIFNSEGIPPPAVYRCMNNRNLSVENYTKHRIWTSGNISKMLKNIVYVGDTAQGKTSKLSFRSKVSVSRPRGDWIIVRGTHEGIISRSDFEEASRRMKKRTCKKSRGFHNVFSGIAECADCGKSMSSCGTRKKDSSANLVCGGYKLRGKEACSNHFIDYDVLKKLVSEKLRSYLSVTSDCREELIRKLEKSSKPLLSGYREAEIAAEMRRERELDLIITQLYEDRAGNRISSERFEKLLFVYEAEAKALSDRLRSHVCPPQEISASAVNIVGFVDDALNDAELDEKILFGFIDRIEVCQGEYVKTDCGRIKRQTVRIFYRFKNPTAEK